MVAKPVSRQTRPPLTALHYPVPPGKLVKCQGPQLCDNCPVCRDSFFQAKYSRCLLVTNVRIETSSSTLFLTYHIAVPLVVVRVKSCIEGLAGAGLFFSITCRPNSGHPHKPGSQRTVAETLANQAELNSFHSPPRLFWLYLPGNSHNLRIYPVQINCVCPLHILVNLYVPFRLAILVSLSLAMDTCILEWAGTDFCNLLGVQTTPHHTLITICWPLDHFHLVTKFWHIPSLISAELQFVANLFQFSRHLEHHATVSFWGGERQGKRLRAQWAQCRELNVCTWHRLSWPNFVRRTLPMFPGQAWHFTHMVNHCMGHSYGHTGHNQNNKPDKHSDFSWSWCGALCLSHYWNKRTVISFWG